MKYTEKQTLAEKTAQNLLEMIQEKGYGAGDKLPTEAELVETLGVGRNTVREALRILMSRNIVTIRQGSGTFISDKNGVADDPLGFFMMDDRRQLTEDLLIQSATTALSEVTKCATVVSDFAPKYSVISKVEVIPTGKRLYVVLLITSNGTIKNKACRLEFDLTEENMQFFRNFMEENLQGVSISDLSEERMEQMITAVSAYMMALSPLVQGVCEMSRDLQKNKVYVSGEQNLLSCQDLNQAEVVQYISHKNELRGLLDVSFKGVKVGFGEEGARFVIGNSSMIVSKYQKGEQAVGSLGIIGPMRLDYAKIIPYIEYFTEKLSHLISEEDDEADNE